jgi:molybdopterin/thiamine biosynthesis adenylyltransferase/rhodanese-related sulfurtransferase
MQTGNPEICRYSRHVALPEVGLGGQRKLQAASVLVIGAGGLGSPVALYLAAAGVGRLGIVDHDAVELSNLQRQILHGTPDVGRPKTASAATALRRLNPGVEVVPHHLQVAAGNALGLIRPYDIVVDGTDNFSTRYLVNDACVLLGKANVYGSIHRFEGQASLFAPHLGGPCYRCLFPEPPPPGTAPNCAEAGVLGVLPGLIGVVQATETIKLILGLGTSLLGRLLLYQALDLRFRELKVGRDPRCAVCGDHPTITQLMTLPQTCGAAANPDEVTVQAMQQALANPALGIQVLDVREADEYAQFRVPGVSLLPLSELAARLAELNPAQSYYLHCKVGVRSLKAVDLLKAAGFQDVKSVRGGILAYAAEIDPKIAPF